MRRTDPQAHPSAFFNIAGGRFSQTGGVIVNQGWAALRVVGVQIDASDIVNRGILQFGRIGTPLTVVRIDGKLVNEVEDASTSPTL